MLIELNGFLIKFAVYNGILDDQGGKGYAAIVVLYLMLEKINYGHSIYLDNFYNSIGLVEHLLKKKKKKKSR